MHEIENKEVLQLLVMAEVQSLTVGLSDREWMEKRSLEEASSSNWEAWVFQIIENIEN